MKGKQAESSMGTLLSSLYVILKMGKIEFCTWEYLLQIGAHVVQVLLFSL